MVDVREIDGAIAEIENSELTMTRVKNLAALYVVKNQQIADASHPPQKAELQEPVRYYEAAEPSTRAAVGSSDFLRAVSNVDIAAALNVLDEFMDALKEVRPDVYNDLVHSLQRK